MVWLSLGFASLGCHSLPTPPLNPQFSFPKHCGSWAANGSLYFTRNKKKVKILSHRFSPLPNKAVELLDIYLPILLTDTLGAKEWAMRVRG